MLAIRIVFMSFFSSGCVVLVLYVSWKTICQSQFVLMIIIWYYFFRELGYRLTLMDVMEKFDFCIENRLFAMERLGTSIRFLPAHVLALSLFFGFW